MPALDTITLGPGQIAYLSTDGQTRRWLDSPQWSATTMDAPELASLRVSLIQALVKIEDELDNRGHGYLQRLTPPAE